MMQTKWGQSELTNATDGGRSYTDRVDTTGMMLVRTAVAGLRTYVQLVLLRVVDLLRKLRSM
ncbi:MAG TPA: hypothetical protein VM784_10835 [Actinomycetota bacterium]|nr:hypothetical protein [Actinomycetota bacterium]